ncbi:acyl-coenzyme A:6-aminopenicillanic acid acyl-transferase-domain-containing protein [Colletotrichum godetiae]|uniref:Acyl-coenzyme A:6-aminopenicillanic acid acyl-transferase-domain-containing protein n=1 Tax=Colletotrichum godetiae TaxID=1209918 RepID=A0AAJ0ETR4_9PEZI|nr:acyl-coenzyme A:6-aminopenicillanic acid acyl-transferase-domain-containing protein [Colletotrichum godetiae]KAK1676491.1 acyl-coenzyme A:6-aminopenicillanic acid acyl-transferase-domain-containing protein [Colletotrichum godetiae]
MIEITVAGTHREIGLAVGQQAAKQVAGSVEFYRYFFKAFSGLEWSTVQEKTLEFMPHLKAKFPSYFEEIEGVAEGAAVDVLDVVTLNIRSEVAFGLFEAESKQDTSGAAAEMAVDGCTALGWKTPGGSTFLSQNWDWKKEQKPNLIIVRARPQNADGISLPAFQMITEAGIIGKIGFNAHGVGCLLNGIRAKGVNSEGMPTHFALRTILESRSKREALEKIESVGLAGSSHILLGDSSGPTGLECTSIGFKELPADDNGRVIHANNLILEHEGVFEPLWLEDSPKRTARMKELATPYVGESAGFVTLLELFKDEQNFPASINRKQIGKNDSGTLFNVVFNLTERRGVISVGRTTEIEEQIELGF